MGRMFALLRQGGFWFRGGLRELCLRCLALMFCDLEQSSFQHFQAVEEKTTEIRFSKQRAKSGSGVSPRNTTRAANRKPAFAHMIEKSLHGYKTEL